MSGTYNGLSLTVVTLASYTALNLAGRVTSSRNARGWLIGGALAMGVGIWSMHFVVVGMLAFSLSIPMSYDIPAAGQSRPKRSPPCCERGPSPTPSHPAAALRCPPSTRWRERPLPLPQRPYR